jgi:hypothetical protein
MPRSKDSLLKLEDGKVAGTLKTIALSSFLMLKDWGKVSYLAFKSYHLPHLRSIIFQPKTR